MFPKEIVHANHTYKIQDKFYTLINRLGFGAYGSVWTSTTQNGDYAAVKVFDFNRSRNRLSATQRLNSFRTEIKVAERMLNETEHIVTMYGYEYIPKYGVAFIVMELADESFSDRVKNLHSKSRLSLSGDYISADDRQNIWIQLVNIVLTLHRYGFIHRDIKPANLLFFGSNLKVIDFGIAIDEYDRYNRYQGTGGTRPYSAPECFWSGFPITSKADIWSIGAILYLITYGIGPLYESSQPPMGSRPTRSSLVQDVLHHCLQRNSYQRADHRWISEHPLTRSILKF
ncbi:hypothetical protein I4U23_011262 [Adineta vaga]|nr:hypothetical protein I4U23_011262 [Adineta vaga]